MIEEYNQLKQKDTNYACSIYTLLNLFKYDYGVIIPLNLILKFLIYLEKAWVFFRLEWAVANIIYPVAIKYINLKYWINLIIQKLTIDQIKEERGYILWFKKATTKYKKSAEDWEITKEDINNFSLYKDNWHFHFWKRWVLVESLGWFKTKLSLENLKEAFTKGFYYPTIRTIVWEEKLRKKLILIAQERKLYLKKNKYIQEYELKDFIKQYK